MRLLIAAVGLALAPSLASARPSGDERIAAVLREARLDVKCGLCHDFVNVASEVSDYQLQGESVLFRKSGSLYVVNDPRTGAYALLAANVERFAVGRGAVAFLRGGALHVAANPRAGSAALVCPDVDRFVVGDDDSVAFLKGRSLYVVTDLTGGDYASVASDVGGLRLQDGRVVFAKGRGLYVLIGRTGSYEPLLAETLASK